MTDGEILIRALFSGYHKLLLHRNELDRTDSFPVPDGDAGSNMSRTMKYGAEAVKQLKESSVTEILEKFSKAMLRNARGNSGIILSVLFKGFSDAAAEKDGVSPEVLRYCLHSALLRACVTVDGPVFDGTMLSVAAAARDCPGDFTAESLPQCFERIADECRRAAEDTKAYRCDLKGICSPDPGAEGLFLIISAVSEVLSGKREGDFRPDADRFKKPGGKNDYARKYRTEFTIIGDGFLPVHELERKLALLGTGVAVASDDGKIKVKLHTDLPHRALGAGLHFGELTGIRIDNLTQTEDRHEHRRQI